MRTRHLIAGAVAMIFVMPVTRAAAEDEFHVTVYNNDLALVKEARQVELPSGVGEFSFVGVPARIDPTSVRLSGRGDGELAVLEQNYRYDLVSREKLLERYLDQRARVVTKHDKVHEGVLKTAFGSLVLETDEGVVLLTADEIADITLPEIPEGLITRPTLVWRLENGGRTSREIEIAYLTGGMSWHTEYVAAVDAKDERMNLTGWVSIDNNSGARYENAHLKVVAGDVHRVTAPMDMLRAAEGRMMTAAKKHFEEREFFEYHIYDLQSRVTLADREVKQIQLFPDRLVPLDKVYVYEPQRGGDKVQVKLEFLNTKENGLGVPLPAGKFRVYREDVDKALEFAGEDRLDHTPRDEKISVLMGNAFDLVGERIEKSTRKISNRIHERTIEIKLRNRKEHDAVNVIVREHPGGFWKVIDASHAWEQPKAKDLEFDVPVKVGEEVVLTYTVRIEY